MTTDIKKEFEEKFYFMKPDLGSALISAEDKIMIAAFLESKISQAVQEERERTLKEIGDIIKPHAETDASIVRPGLRYALILLGHVKTNDTLSHLGGDKE